jgi:hypothetical protein
MNKKKHIRITDKVEIWKAIVRNEVGAVIETFSSSGTSRGPLEASLSFKRKNNQWFSLKCVFISS